MNVAVITRHAITNYGSLLQAFATQRAIESLGHSCKIIDYIRKDESYIEHEKTILKKKSNWNKSILRRCLYLILRQPESIWAGKRFEKERIQLLNLTCLYDSVKKLEDNTPVADIFLTGSDQVWGPVENGDYDKAYCLAFTDKKKISYAASFGRTDFSDKISSYYREMLSKYSSISVREESAVEYLQSINISAEQVLDPTLLLNWESWSKIAKPIKEKKYILIYQIHNDKKLGEYAKKVSRITGLSLIRISSALHQFSRPGKFIFCPSIGEFLTYIKNAELVITDSFHGTAFSINFNTQFIEILPNNNTGTRNISILNLTGLENRILRDLDNVELVYNKIDFTYANECIQNEREKSIAFLDNAISGG